MRSVSDSSVLRASTILFNPTLEDERGLQELSEQSAVLWNIANYERRKAFFEHSDIPSYSAQCKSLKSNEAFKKLGTYRAQALLQKLDEAWQSFWSLLRLRQKGILPNHIRKVSPPRYWKKNGVRELRGFYVRNDGWRMDENIVSVSKNLKIPYTCGETWVGKKGRLEVEKDILNGKWYAHIPVEVEKQPPCCTSQKVASLDLGICNLATLYIENERPLIYSGRAVLSDWVYRTKKIAEKQNKLPKGKHKSKSIQIAFRKRQRRLKHAINSMLRSIFERLEAKNIGELFFGDLNGIRAEANHGYNGNQKLHNFWTFNLIAKRIHELGEEFGVKTSAVSERDTSKTCCLCGKKHNARIKRGLVLCKEMHKSINADVNGAVNILKVAVKRPFSTVLSTLVDWVSGSRLMAQPLLLRWNYNDWL